MALYAGPGRRRILPPLVFGLGVLWHLLRHGRRYDVVHTASFPYFSLLAAGALRRLARLPARRRLARGLDARLLGRVPRADRRADRPRRPDALPADPAARLLLLAPARAAACVDGRPARRADRARGRVRRAARATRAAPGRAARRVRRPPHPGEARRRRVVPAIAALRALASGPARPSSSATAPSAPRVLAAIVRELGLTERHRRARLRRRREVERDARAARSAWCCRRSARATA